MQGFNFLVAAYAIAWLGLFAYLAFVAMRIRGVQTELAAVEELVREQQEKQDNANLLTRVASGLAGDERPPSA